MFYPASDDCTSGFDIVIGNPPYGVSIKGNYRSILEESLGKVPDYEMYYYFFEVAKILCSKNGTVSYIVPNTYLFNTFAKKYRTNMLEKWEIIEILDCSRFKIFESATVLNTINLFRNIVSSKKIGYRNTSKATNFDELIKEKRQLLPHSILLKMNQNWGLAFKLNEQIINLVFKIKQNECLETEFKDCLSQGLIAYDKYKGQNEYTIKNRIFHSFEYKAGLKKNLWGEDISRYCLQWNGKEYIDYCNGIANPRKPKFFSNKRILIREITNPSIFATYTEDEYYNDPSLLIIIENPNGKFKLKYILGILNSRLATFYHFNASPKATKGSFPKILVQDLKDFPIPTASPAQQQEIITLVDKILKTKKTDPTADTTDLEKQIDQLVYKLYGLTDEEIDVIEEK